MTGNIAFSRSEDIKLLLIVLVILEVLSEKSMKRPEIDTSKQQ